MTYKTRRLLFWGLLTFFIIFSPLVVFYSQGYRFDFQKLQIFKIGGLFLDVRTGGAEISINGKIQSESGGLLYSGSFFKLLPKNYDIRISKDKYYDWQKTLGVKPNLITQALNIILFPKDRVPEKILPRATEFFSMSPDRSKILTAMVTSATATSSPTLKVALNDLNGETVADFSALPLKTAQKSAVKISAVRWFGTNEDFLVKLNIGKTSHWVLGSKKTDAAGAKTRRIVFIDDAIRQSLSMARLATSLSSPSITLDELFPHPLDPQKILFQDGGNIYAFDFKIGGLKELDLGDTKTQIFDSFLVKNANVWWLDKNGTLRRKDLNVDLNKDISQIPNFSATSSYEFLDWNGAFGVGSAKKTYVFDENRGDFIALPAAVSMAKFSPDSKKLAYSLNGEVRVRYLEEIRIGDVKKTGAEDLIASGVKNIFWHEQSAHLILITRDAVRIAELDGRPERNVAELVKTGPVTAYYDPGSGKIYFLDADGFLKTASLQ